jgi:hypothetical protein
MEMGNRVIERAYESIRSYLPEDAKAVLSEQVPQVEGFIDEELSKFGEELAEYIASEVSQLVDASQREAVRSHNEVVAAVGELRARVVAEDASLEAAVEKLERSLDEYEHGYRVMGESVRQSVVAAIRAAGIPLPGS